MIEFFRGPKESYNQSEHGSGIYFALNTKEIIHDGITYLGELPDNVFRLTQQVNKNTGDLLVLKGTGEGSIKKQIDDAINLFATKISDDDTVNTFIELIDYAANNKGEVGDLIVNVSDIEQKVSEQTLVIEQLQTELITTQQSLQLQIDGQQTAIDNLSKEIDNKIETAFSWENA